MYTFFHLQISGGDISSKAVVALAKPFAEFLSYGEETRLASSITRNVFIYLFRQTDVGMEYQERLQAWKSVSISINYKKSQSDPNL